MADRSQINPIGLLAALILILLFLFVIFPALQGAFCPHMENSAMSPGWMC